LPFLSFVDLHKVTYAEPTTAIVGLYWIKASDQPTKVAFYLPIDPANTGANNNIKYYVTTFENGDAETILASIHDFKELIQLKGVNDNYEVQIVKLRKMPL
jgi:hypothetical protein